LKYKLSSSRFYLYYLSNLDQQEQIQEPALMRQLQLRPQGVHKISISRVCSRLAHLLQGLNACQQVEHTGWFPTVQMAVSFYLKIPQFVHWAKSAMAYRLAIKRFASKICSQS